MILSRWSSSLSRPCGTCVCLWNRQTQTSYSFPGVVGLNSRSCTLAGLVRRDAQPGLPSPCHTRESQHFSVLTDTLALISPHRKPYRRKVGLGQETNIVRQRLNRQFTDLPTVRVLAGRKHAGSKWYVDPHRTQGTRTRCFFFKLDPHDPDGEWLM